LIKINLGKYLMEKSAQRLFLIVAALLSLVVMLATLLLAGGLHSFEMTQAHMFFIIGTLVLQFCTLVYLLINNPDDDK